MKNFTQLSRISMLIFVLVFSNNIFSQDFKVQHIQDDVVRTGGTNTSFTAVSSLNNAVTLANSNRKSHAGRSDLNAGDLEGDDMSGARQLTGIGTITYYREPLSTNNSTKFNSSIWEYTGPSGGENEMIVRGRYAVILNGTNNNVTQALSGITNANKCIPFINGILNNSGTDDADSGSAIAYLENATTLRVQKGSNANNVTVYVTVVEFTGSNWTVLHGDSGNSATDSGNITLRNGSNGTGTPTNVSSWSDAIIFGHHRGDMSNDGTDDALADNWPVMDPGINNQTVDWTFHTDHDGTNRHFVHVLNNPYLNVTRYQNNSNSAGETTIDITSAGLSNTSEALIIGSSTSSGGGNAYARGWRNYYLKSTTQAAHWAHRNLNTMAHEIQIVDLSRLISPSNITDFGPDSKWRYLDDGSNQGTAWKASAFDDSSWAVGDAQLGYGDGDTATTISFGGDPNNKHITTYFRKSFNVTAGEAAESNLILNALRDDGLVVYLNGTEIWRDNMPVGTILYNTTTANAPDDGDTWLSTTIANNLLVGTNVIAAEVHQTSITSSDVVFNFDIQVDTPTIATFGPGGVWKYLDDGSNQGTAWRASAFDDSSWASGNAELGFNSGDEPVEATIITDVNQITNYFRKNVFVTAGEAAETDLIFDIVRDDGIVVYVNGVEVGRDNMPGGTILYNTLANTAISGAGETAWNTFTLSNVLVSGMNTIAVEIHQNVATSSDVSFDMDMRVETPGTKEINILGNSNNIVDGATTTSISNDTEFYSPDTITNITHTFTIENLGNGATTINLTGGPIVAISGDSEFSVSAQPATTAIIGGTSTTFDVTFNPTDENWKTAVISIANDDSDENPYTFTVNGKVNNVDNFGPSGEWKYLDDGSNQGTAWSSTTYNDASWASGDAELGYGEGDEATVVSYGSDSNDKYPTTYFRKTFNVSAAEAAMSVLTMKAIRDDGMVVYINGTQVWSDGMPGTWDYSTYANVTIGGGDESTWNQKNISNILVAGNNTIAVEIHQTNASSSDLSFNFDIELKDYILPYDSTWKYLDDGSNQGTAWTGTGFNDSGWASGAAELGYGDGDEATTVSYGGDANNKHVTTYFRKTFTVSAGDAAKNKLHLEGVFDDGAVVYINGTKVWMFNMPYSYNYTSLAEEDLADAVEPRWWTYELKNLLVTGSNTVAVEVHQQSVTSTDISFNFGMYVSDDYVFTPIILDNDGDTALDWDDGDDDNDGVPDIVEGCVTADMEDLNTSGSEDVLASFPYTTTLSDGNVITYSVSDINDFNSGNGITSYEAGDQGWGLRVSGADTDGLLTLTFTTAVDNLFFKLVDFDENEQWTVNVYDDTNTLIDLTNRGVAHLGYHVEQNGNGFNDRTNSQSDNVDGDDHNWNIYGGLFLYFPDDRVSRIEFSTVQNQGSTIRIVGIQYCNQDTDGDGIQDYFDSDSDNDSIPDIVEAGGVDTDGDGLIDSPIDTDKDGILDTYDQNPSSFLVEDPSTIIDYNFDGDSVPNRIDLDSDNDGILDIIEVNEPDTDGNGQIDGFIDTNNDGYHDSYDGASSRLITGSDSGSGIPTSYPYKNQDGTGLPNYSDIDSDDDGITDNTEAQLTSSFITYTITDTDGDGINNVFDSISGFGGNGLIPIDTDFDCIPDYLDTNSDDDLEDDRIEGHDTNNDGVADSGSNANNGVFTGVDTDGDGLDNGYDNNNSTYSSTNSTLQPNSHPNNDGLYDRDWRASNSPIDFDGINDFIDFGDNHDISGPIYPTSAFSLEAWVLQQSTSASEGTIISKRDAKSGNERGYHLVINSSNRPNLTWYSAAGTKMIDITSSHPISNNKWYHIAATYDGTDATLYVDGVEVGSGSSATPPSIGNEKFMIGAMYDSDNACTSATKYFDGYIDEVRIWNVALTVTQVQQMMNQEIVKVGANVQGSVIPKNIPGLTWANLKGYYPMTSNIAVDASDNSFNGFPKYINTIQSQTAPLPYTTVRAGDWRNNTASTPWTHGNTVWNLPNSFGIDGTTPINWNIVQTDHNVFIDTYTDVGRERHVLGLLVNANTLTVRGVTNKVMSTYTGNGLNVNWYLELNDKLDLEGESQLIQPINSDLVVGASGILEKDQQGTRDFYTYNYWSSPVGFTASANPNNYSYTLNNNIFKDGTTSSSPANITFVGGYNGSIGPPISIAHYWIWKFGNLPSGDYSAWQHVRNSGTIKAGEGFTMKGVADTSGNLTLEQNFVFQGKPNNGDILTLNLTANNDYLVGNPYASAIDAEQFILDNGPLIDYTDPGGFPEGDPLISGTLYFWEHWGGGSHVLADYQGGYGTYNLSGGTPAAAYGNPDPDVAQVGTGTKLPGRYIPVGQGFFVTGETTGTINFNNGQRRFQNEGSAASVFVRQANNLRTENDYVDPRMRIRLGFNSVNTIHRQLLVTEDSRATLDVDWGFDGLLYQNQMDDMYWLLEDEKYTIQGIDDISESTILPLGVHTSNPGMNNIVIDILENVPNDIAIYLHDKELEIYHDLRISKYEIYLEAGEYLDRFELTFSNQLLSVEENEIINSLHVSYVNTSENILIQNPKLIQIKSAELLNTIGQSIYSFDNIKTQENIEIQTKKLSVGTYIIKLQTEIGVINKKVLVN